MRFRLFFTDEAKKNLDKLQKDKGLRKRLKAVRKTLGYLETNPRHQSLHTHKYLSLTGKRGEDILEAYAESKTLALYASGARRTRPSAYRIFWHYGPGKNIITIIAITPHP